MSGSAFNPWQRGRKLVAAAVVVASAGAASVFLWAGGPGHPGGMLVPETANIWVNATAGASPVRCSTACAYDGTKAYGSISAAVAAASCGDTIVVKAGGYGAQTVSTVPSCSSSMRVAIRGEAGASPVLAGLTLGSLSTVAPSHLAFSDLTVGTQGGITIWADGDDIQFTDVKAGFLLDQGTSDVSVSGGELGDCESDASTNCVTKVVDQQINNLGTDYIPNNVTFNDVSFHDVTSSDTNLYHVECFFLASGTNITIEDSSFYNCQLFDLFVSHYTTQTGTEPPSLVSVINNRFDEPYTDAAFTTESPEAILFRAGADVYDQWTVAFNSFYGTTTPSTTGEMTSGTATASTFTNFDVTGNLMGKASGGVSATGCLPGATYSYNVLVQFSSSASSATCGTGDTVQTYNGADFGYSDGGHLNAGGDWTLAPGAAGIGVVSSATCAAITTVDRVGLTRPNVAHSSFCDAGASENR